MMNRLLEFAKNPMQALVKSQLNIPQNVQTQSPNDIIQYLLDSGQLTQDQYNQINQKAKGIQKQLGL